MAGTLGYPWPSDTQAPCEFGSAGGPSCTNPNNPSDKYDWGVYTNGVFHPYRNGYEYRNCTDYVQWKESTIGAKVPSNWGNGGQWYNSAPASERSLNPQAWDAAVVPGNPGHVAFVESVNTNGTITVSEYNHNTQGTGDTRTGTASMGFTEFINFGVHPSSGGGAGGKNDLHLAAVGTDANVYELDQTSPGAWSPNWNLIPGQVLSTSMTATPNDGLLHIAAVGTDGNIYITNQQTNGHWGAWNEVRAQVAEVSIAATPEGKLHLAALGTDHKVYVLDQVNTGGPWSPSWNDLQGDVNTVSMTDTPQNGKLHIAAVGTDGNVYVVDQQPSNGQWGAWSEVKAQVVQVAIGAT